MKANYVFYQLAKQANEIWGPAATPTDIFREFDQACDKALREEQNKLTDLMDSCSLAKHPLVVEYRRKKTERQLAKAIQRQAITMTLIAGLLDSLKPR